MKAYLKTPNLDAVPYAVPFKDLSASNTYPAPINATSIAVTWNLQENPNGQNDLTRYLISIERKVGCKFSPIVKFQVPVSQVPVDDCAVNEKSKLRGVTKPFRVKVCAGDELCVSVTKTLGEICPVGCGVTVEVDQSQVSNLDVALVSLYLF